MIAECSPSVAVRDLHCTLKSWRALRLWSRDGPAVHLAHEPRVALVILTTPWHTVFCPLQVSLNHLSLSPSFIFSHILSVSFCPSFFHFPSPSTPSAPSLSFSFPVIFSLLLVSLSLRHVLSLAMTTLMSELCLCSYKAK